MTIFDQEVAAALESKMNNRAANIKQYLNDASQNIYIIGKNDESTEFAARYKVVGVIDDFGQAEESWNGLPITKTSNVPKDSIIINCVTSISPVQVTRNLKSAGLSNVVEVADLISEDGKLLPFPWFVSQQRAEIKQYISWWRDLYDMMSDETSRKVLLDVLRFRLTANPKYMLDYEVRLKEQYFEDFMEYKEEVFVDAGGYDGDTTEEFINRYSDYKKVYLFEPSQKNLSAAKRRLSGRRDIDFRSVGLSHVSGTLHFDADAGSASAITNGRGESISVVTLDEELRNEPISFIKMDLEGWEINALRGAEQTIKNNKPKLAIAVYHAAKDFREIPQYLLGLNPSYKVYLRHYTQGWSETVMFFM
jgi:FkbM family methyltransferase